MSCWLPLVYLTEYFSINKLIERNSLADWFAIFCCFPDRIRATSFFSALIRQTASIKLCRACAWLIRCAQTQTSKHINENQRTKDRKLTLTLFLCGQPTAISVGILAESFFGVPGGDFPALGGIAFRFFTPMMLLRRWIFSECGCANRWRAQRLPQKG